MRNGFRPRQRSATLSLVTPIPDFILHRLANQRLGSAAEGGPGVVVSRMGAMQAQDYLGALWAVGLRLPNASEADVEQALNERQIIRTWPMRGTLHFVAAADIRWILQLLAPSAIAKAAGRFRELGLDETDMVRSRKAVQKALQGGRALSREALYEKLESAKVSTAGQRGIHVLGRLAQEGLICFGARQGKQHTFVLLEEWAPPAETLGREQALAELARRYFSGHGPATLRDFVWWSGLTMADARAGLEMVQRKLLAETIEGRTYWRPEAAPAARRTPPTACLLPAFDEYLVGYTDRSAVLDPVQAKHINAGGGMLSAAIVIDGQVVGTWKRMLKKKAVVITPSWFLPPKKARERAFGLAASRYGAFLKLPVEIDQAQA